MSGERHWSTGITVAFGRGGTRCGPDGRMVAFYGWRGVVAFLDIGVRDDPGRGHVLTQGELTTRNYVGDLGPHPTVQEHASALGLVVDALKRDAEEIGVRWGVHAAVDATVYYEGDGEDPNHPPPAGWRSLVNAQAARLGWAVAYRER